MATTFRRVPLPQSYHFLTAMCFSLMLASAAALIVQVFTMPNGLRGSFEHPGFAMLSIAGTVLGSALFSMQMTRNARYYRLIRGQRLVVERRAQPIDSAPEQGAEPGPGFRGTLGKMMGPSNGYHSFRRGHPGV